MIALATDLLIAAVIGGVPVAFAYAWKRGTAPGAMHWLAALAWLVVAYGSFVEPRMLAVREYAANIVAADAVESASARTLHIAVISDLHLGEFRHTEWLERVVAAVNAQHPDAVLIAGDLASNEAGTAMFAPLAKLQSEYGTYAVLGNWDYHVGAVMVRKAVESHRVEVLTNESVAIGPEGAQLFVAGLDDHQHGTPDWNAALSAVPAGAAVAAFSHNPDAAYEAEVRGVPMVIAGHTHGGQVRLPFLGPVPPLPTKLGRRYDKGVLRMGPVTLFITPGVGESSARARLLQPPEVSILTLSY